MPRTARLVLTAAWISGFGLLGIAGVSDRGWAQEAPEEPTQGTVEVADEPRFTCQLENGQYTVMYSPVSQPGEFYPWAVPEDMGGAWPAERRCNEISRRLEEYRPDGLLELQNDIENGYDTVCVTTEAVGGCRIVFTVPPGQDPQITRDSVFNNLVLADQGDTTQGVTTFTGEGSDVLDDLNEVLGLPSGNSSSQSNDGINLQPFLDSSDGGTGTQLSPNTGRRLNPDNF
ncbi:MAG: COP23 domain-containing protein [Cyanobacteria bacterium P01_F01_bin.86]